MPVRRSPPSLRSPPETALLRLARIAGITLIATFAAFALALLTVRFVVFPQVESYRDDLTAALSRELGQPVEIDALETGWEGWNPKLGLTGFRVRDRARAIAAPLLDLPRVDMVVAWTSLPFLELRLKRLVIERPRLSIRRDRAGMLHVAGIEIDPAEAAGDTRLTDWILDQREILVRDALVAWDDDLRNAPQLLLDHVQLRLEHRFGEHRFGLHGTPPAELAAPIDIRGEWRGGSVSDWRSATGRMYVHLEYADVAAWREWLALPVQVDRGKGALQLWFGFGAGVAQDIVGDVELEDAVVRFEDRLPELRLDHVAGRFGWREQEGQQQVFGHDVRFALAGGGKIDPSTFTVSWREASAEVPALLRVEFDRLQLEPLRAVAANLPLPDPVRADLARYAPRGTLTRGRLQWDGPRDAPTAYAGRADFSDLGVVALGVLPGGSGLSGSVDFSEAGGTLKLQTQAAALDLPRVFLAPLAFDRLDGVATWRRKAGAVELRLESLDFANPHATGRATGTYRSAATGPGVIDLSARLSDGDLTQAYRYLPRWIDSATRDWLRLGIKKGRATEATLKLAGNLADFPFADGKPGTFLVEGKTTGVVLDYADRWPPLTDLDAAVRFAGKGLVVEGRSARVYGAEVGGTRAEIPDLDAEFPRLAIAGDAAGPVADFLRFVEESPVAGWIGDVTDRAEGAGRGQLKLRLDLVLGSQGEDKVAGAFTFVDAQLRLRGVPLLANVNGVLEFTEADVRAREIAVDVAGGPARISVRNDAGRLRVDAAGSASVAAVRREFTLPFADRIAGPLPWTIAIDLGDEAVAWTIDSTLKGTTVDLPAPLGKRPDDAVALRIARRPLAGRTDRDTLAVTYGGILDAALQRELTPAGPVVERGLIELGDARRTPGAVRADRPGVWLRAKLPELDLDRWLGELKRDTGATAEPGAAAPELAGFDLDVAAMEAFGGRWNDLRITGRSARPDLRLTLAGREVEGTAVWSPAAPEHLNGRLVARLSRLATGGGGDRSAGPRDATRNDPAIADAWPELDVVADAYVSKDHELGRLEILAKPRGSEWRIERLQLANADGTIAADGAWRGSGPAQQTKLDVALDVRDAAGFLGRLGFPAAVQGAPTRINGQLAWAGAPNAFDYPTLAGTFRVDVGAGRFTKLEPGIGKLLGVLSLQALPRRITLDFRDVFSEGFAFDQINGTVRVERGILTTDNLKLAGPAAKVEISGDADLERETQRLRVRVQPTLSAGVSAGAALLFLANPVVGAVVGAGSLLAQKMLQDPIEQMFSYTYDVSGSWSDPVVTRGGAAAAATGQEVSPR